jgi:uncharacterized membrane protein
MTKPGRLIFALAIIALGIENLIYAHFGQVVVPVLPWVPGKPVLAYLVGIALLVAGLGFLTKAGARLSAAWLGSLLALCMLLLEISRVAASPLDLAIRSRCFETLAICGVALVLVGTLPRAGDQFYQRVVTRDRFTRIGCLLFALASVVFGIDHFLILHFIAGLIPSWIPGRLFWAYFTGIAFIAAGVSIATAWLARWAATLLGVMFGLWFFLLHAPRLANSAFTHDPNEWSSAFIALAMWGGCWIIAGAFSGESW